MGRWPWQLKHSAGLEKSEAEGESPFPDSRGVAGVGSAPEVCKSESHPCRCEDRREGWKDEWGEGVPVVVGGVAFDRAYRSRRLWLSGTRWTPNRVKARLLSLPSFPLSHLAGWLYACTLYYIKPPPVPSSSLSLPLPQCISTEAGQLDLLLL
ncbi:hypothetical protein FA13DRAFT_1452345 [Coprinellus micaceus]|uniref:Uncharacterized protein n=1 Tax=Coprinellus micaceus TaxID=71717 RepID=A0A4Y7SNF9_COPMI|nr:hypothetical protein FA13DRAFT_1452345 [Coprinellus micaceus]